jgi:hypothetical protein
LSCWIRIQEGKIEKNAGSGSALPQPCTELTFLGPGFVFDSCSGFAGHRYCGIRYLYILSLNDILKKVVHVRYIFFMHRVGTEPL